MPRSNVFPPSILSLQPDPSQIACNLSNTSPPCSADCPAMIQLLFHPMKICPLYDGLQHQRVREGRGGSGRCSTWTRAYAMLVLRYCAVVALSARRLAVAGGLPVAALGGRECVAHMSNTAVRNCALYCRSTEAWRCCD